MIRANKIPPTFYKEIWQLLRESHAPKVKVAESRVVGGGDGVFLETDVEDISKPLCFYPGVYTPGLPLHAIMDDASVYLANEREVPPPSGVPMGQNAYIYNLSSLGGYLDGLATRTKNGRRLDTNPSACGHKINHSGSCANAKLVPFYWKDVLQLTNTEKATNHEGSQFDLPNAMRDDCAPWYFDAANNKLCRFSNNDTGITPLCGAAVLLEKPQAAGNELYINYNLKLPLPPWASNWYQL